MTVSDFVMLPLDIKEDKNLYHLYVPFKHVKLIHATLSFLLPNINSTRLAYLCQKNNTQECLCPRIYSCKKSKCELPTILPDPATTNVILTTMINFQDAL